MKEKNLPYAPHSLSIHLDPTNIAEPTNNYNRKCKHPSSKNSNKSPTNEPITFSPTNTIDAIVAVHKSQSYIDHHNKNPNHYKTGTLLLPCDLITNANDIQNLINQAKKSKDDTGIFCLYSNLPCKDSENPLPGTNASTKLEPENLYMIDRTNSKLLDIVEPNEYINEKFINNSGFAMGDLFEQHGNLLSFSNKKGKDIEITNRIQDLHTYFMKSWLINFCVATRKCKVYSDLPYDCIEKENINEKDQLLSFDIFNSFGGIQNDLIPFMVSYYRSHPLANNHNLCRHKISQSFPLINHHGNPNNIKFNLFQYFKDQENYTAHEAEFLHESVLFSNIYNCSRSKQVHNRKSGMVKIIHSDVANTTTRVKNFLNYNCAIQNFLTMDNKNQLQTKIINFENDIKFTKSNSIVSPTTLLNSADIKNHIKNSSICNNVNLGKNCFVINSFINDNCVIMDNSKLSNCYLFSNVVIPKDCHLKDCIIMPQMDQGFGFRGMNMLHENCTMQGEVLEVPV